ncbi:hypothetical protein [Ornithinimicrobium flavum]|uniref:hypothetical protein n=1 Tax=Ornithinimicrobium flavum TaxID=1288636 RepID=UPI00106FC06D|nr:hypothetical protein [Ornithinimicrobium flavum]
MTTPWPDLTVSTSSQALGGDGSFRMMPTDAFAAGPASGRVEVHAGGHALLATYTWTHPQDGPQEGVLLVGSPEEDGTVRATWLDGWHQQPGPMHLSGSLEGDTVRLGATYADTWGWQVDLTLGRGTVRMVMRNVVPEEAVAQAPEGTNASAGPYDVMDLRLTCGPPG